MKRVACSIAVLVVTVALSSAAAPKRWRRDARSGLEMVFIPGGSFHFGCEPRDAHCFDDEKPGRSATVRSFWMARTDVTVAAFAKCVAAGACLPPETGGACNWQVPGREQHPINCIDWHAANAYCASVGLRLPSEEEWEYAAKGGESRVFPWGDEPVNATRANFCDARCGALHRDWTWVDATHDDGWATTSPVGSFPAGASKHGVVDLAGNAAQWTASDGKNGTKIVRGGAWDLYERYLRASARVQLTSSRWYDNVTVRCVR